MDRDRYVLVMDWVNGRSLAEILHTEGRPGLPLKRVQDYLRQTARALEHLHAHRPRVAHGDIKPANLILTEDRRVVLVDFGIAGSSSSRSRRQGTRGFMAPELTREGPTPRSDVYSLAATAYTLLTGEPPTADVHPQWRLLGRRESRRLRYAIRRGLAMDPARRPDSPRRFLELLERPSQKSWWERRRGFVTAAAITLLVAFSGSLAEALFRSAPKARVAPIVSPTLPATTPSASDLIAPLE